MKSKSTIKLIAILSLLGGLVLLFISLRDLILQEQSIEAGVVRILVGALAFSQTFGALQILKDDRGGIKLLILCYLIESFAFSFESFAYLLTAGPVIMLKYDAILNKIDLDLSIFQVAYKIVLSDEYSFFSVNLLSLGILIYLLRVRDNKGFGE